MAYKKLVTNKLQEIAYWCSFEEEKKRKKRITRTSKILRQGKMKG